MLPHRIFLYLLIGLCLLSPGQALRAQNPRDVRRALADLRSDDIPHNCSEAVVWLGRYRDKLKDDLVDELYKTDRQGRDAIFYILFRTKSFVPDERFKRLLITRLDEGDTYVKMADINPQSSLDPDFDKLSTQGCVHWEAWIYMDRHFDQFETMIAENLGRSDHVQVLWQTAWLFKKRGVLDQHRDSFTPALLAKVATNLKDDNERFNASQAVRLFLLLGEQSLPTLKTAAQSRDPQMADLARATADALSKGSRKAFGFLCARVRISTPVFGTDVAEPAWLSQAMEPYVENEKRYRP